MRAAFILWRMRRRAGRPAVWWSWGLRVLGGAGILSAWLLGGLLRELPPLAMRAGPVGPVVPGLVLLFTGLVALLVGIGSTAGGLWRDAREEAGQLLTLPIRPIDLARTRLFETLLDGWKAGSAVALLLLSVAAGAWGIGVVLPWIAPLALAGALEVTVLASLGALLVLLTGLVVPSRRREPVLLAMLVGGLGGAAALSGQIVTWMTRVSHEGPGSLLRTVLAPMRAAIRFYRLLASWQPEAVVYTVGFSTAAALLVWLCLRGWTCLLRRDLLADARPSRKNDGAGLPAGPVARRSPSSRLPGVGPSPARAVWLRDLRLLSRSSAFRLRAILLPATLLVLFAAELPVAWPLLLLYFAPFELVRDGLVRSLEAERGSSFILRTQVPSIRRYLAWRLVGASAAILPGCALALALATLLNDSLRSGIGLGALRLGLLAVVSWLAPIAGLAEASLVGLARPGSALPGFGASSGLASTAAGLLVAGGCLWIDRVAAGGSVGDGVDGAAAGAILAVASLLLATAVSPLLLRRLARLWERWSES